MSKLLELATDLVSSHASMTPMSKEDLVAEINEVYAALTALESGEAVEVATAEDADAPVVSKRKAFGKNKIYCMVCGKGFTTLKRHLSTAHEMTPREYRDKFDIPAGTVLAAKAYSESRRQMAIDKDLGAGLAKARAKRAKKK
ncbi:MAG: MucR family transcriptional regulator [Desulfuromonas sp.]|nr:MAG: MucR family transcriptional regulator [Desulfuromonas sp.]